MNITISTKITKTIEQRWTITNDSIHEAEFCKGIENNKECSFDEIGTVEHYESKPNKNGSILLYLKGKKKTALPDISLFFSHEDRIQAKEAYEYIENSTNGIINRIAREDQFQEIRMKCKVCGNIYCFTGRDIKNSKSNEFQSGVAALGGIMSAFSGSAIGTYMNTKMSDESASKAIDYTRCPKCGSYDVFLMKDNEQCINNQQTVSSADEIKKYKELLDSGIITQEEFDAKKKQLLGL